MSIMLMTKHKLQPCKTFTQLHMGRYRVWTWICKENQNPYKNLLAGTLFHLECNKQNPVYRMEGWTGKYHSLTTKGPQLITERTAQPWRQGLGFSESLSCPRRRKENPGQLRQQQHPGPSDVSLKHLQISNYSKVSSRDTGISGDVEVLGIRDKRDCC